jgi:hypothetical protein
MNQRAKLIQVGTTVSEQLDLGRALTNAPMRIPVEKPEIDIEGMLRRQGKISITYIMANSDRTANELAAGVKVITAGTSVLTAADNAWARVEELQSLLTLAKGVDKRVRKVAIDAFVNTDWIYIVDDDVRRHNGGNVVKDFHAFLERALLDNNDVGTEDMEGKPAKPMIHGGEDRASLRTKWIERLSIEVPLLLGPLALNPIIPSDAANEEVFRKLHEFLSMRGVGDSVRKLEVLAAQERIDHTDFERLRLTSYIKEVEPNLRDLDWNDANDLCTIKKLALLALVATQQQLRDFRDQNGLTDTVRKKRTPINPQRVLLMDTLGNVVGELEDLTLTYPTSQHGRIASALRSAFVVGLAVQEICRVFSGAEMWETAEP